MPIVALFKNWVHIPMSCTILHFIVYGVSQDVTIARWSSYKAYDRDRHLIFLRIRKVQGTIMNNSFLL